MLCTRCISYSYTLFPWRFNPIPGLPLRGFAITFTRRTTRGRTPLYEWSACCRDLYLTTHNTHKRQTSTLPAGFEPTFPARQRPQTYALDLAATGITISIFLGEVNLKQIKYPRNNKQFNNTKISNVITTLLKHGGNTWCCTTRPNNPKFRILNRRFGAWHACKRQIGTSEAESAVITAVSIIQLRGVPLCHATCNQRCAVVLCLLDGHTVIT
jgi:hypothetical protein